MEINKVPCNGKDVMARVQSMQERIDRTCIFAQVSVDFDHVAL